MASSNVIELCEKFLETKFDKATLEKDAFQIGHDLSDFLAISDAKMLPFNWIVSCIVSMSAQPEQAPASNDENHLTGASLMRALNASRHAAYSFNTSSRVTPISNENCVSVMQYLLNWNDK